MQPAAAHVDRLDALLAPFGDGEDVAFHQHLIVADQAAEWAESEQDAAQRRAVGRADVEYEAAVLDRKA